MTVDTCGAGGAHTSGTPDLTLDDFGVHIFPCGLCVCVCRSTLSMSPVCPLWLLRWYLFLNIHISNLKKENTNMYVKYLTIGMILVF